MKRTIILLLCLALALSLFAGCRAYMPFPRLPGEDPTTEPTAETEPATTEAPRPLTAEEIHQAAQNLDPSRINRYVTELAARFHRFYTACRLKGAEEDILNARLQLADCTRRVIALSLSIIGVSAPEKM